MQELSVRIGLDVRHESFHSDFARLIRELKQLQLRRDVPKNNDIAQTHKPAAEARPSATKIIVAVGWPLLVYLAAGIAVFAAIAAWR